MSSEIHEISMPNYIVGTKYNLILNYIYIFSFIDSFKKYMHTQNV